MGGGEKPRWGGGPRAAPSGRPEPSLLRRPPSFTGAHGACPPLRRLPAPGCAPAGLPPRLPQDSRAHPLPLHRRGTHELPAPDSLLVGAVPVHRVPVPQRPPGARGQQRQQRHRHEQQQQQQQQRSRRHPPSRRRRPPTEPRAPASGFPAPRCRGRRPRSRRPRPPPSLRPGALPKPRPGRAPAAPRRVGPECAARGRLEPCNPRAPRRSLRGLICSRWS